MSERIRLRTTGEALVEREPAWPAAKREVIIGEHQDQVARFYHQPGVDEQI
jgi:hypothetical protein